MKRSVRVLALLMALIILFASPLRVAATSVVVGQAIVTGASALLVVAGILYGLGVMPSSDPTVFETTRDAGVEYLRAGGHVDDDGFMEIIGYQDPAGVLRTYVSQNIIESVRDWLYDSDTIVYSCPFISTDIIGSWLGGTHHYVGSVPFAFFGCNYHITTSSGSRTNCVVYAISGSSGYICKDSFSNTKVTLKELSSGVYGTTLLTGSKAIDPSTLSNVSFLEFYGSSWDDCNNQFLSSVSLAETITTSLDLSLGSVASPDSKIDTGYETWVDESIKSIDVGIQFEDDPEDPNDDDKNIVPFWPVHTGNSLPTGTVQEMQSAAQSGLTDLELDFNGGSGSGDGSNTGDSPGTSTNPSENVSKFALDLTEFFPFCIPFDIYEFLSILAAEPEAPVFHWEIPVPQLNKTFEFDVDLSVWDDIAQLFRNLELLAFIIGLAMVTRDKFIRG